jgi:hypothetical protein
MGHIGAKVRAPQTKTLASTQVDRQKQIKSTDGV